MNKNNKIILLIIVIVIIGLSASLITKTNQKVKDTIVPPQIIKVIAAPQPINIAAKDSTTQNIMNPNLSIYKQFEWTTWQDTVGGKTAHDNRWFKKPSEKYLKKEIIFNPLKNDLKDKSFKDNVGFTIINLCMNDSFNYETSSFPDDIKNKPGSGATTWFYIRKAQSPIKNMKEIINKDPLKYSIILNSANQNPFINPNYKYVDFTNNQVLDFDLNPVDENHYKDTARTDIFGLDTFREYMAEDGSIYRINFDSTTRRYSLPQKVNKSESQYYSLYREVDYPEIKPLGIYGQEEISIEVATGKLIAYKKSFRMALSFTSADQIEVNWEKNKDVCASVNSSKPIIVQSLED